MSIQPTFYDGQTRYTNGNGHLYDDPECTRISFVKTKTGYQKASSVNEDRHFEYDKKKKGD